MQNLAIARVQAVLERPTIDGVQSSVAYSTSHTIFNLLVYFSTRCQHVALPHPLHTIYCRIFCRGIRAIECFYKYHVYFCIIECERKDTHRHTCTHAHQRIVHQCFYNSHFAQMLLTKTIAWCTHASHKGLYHVCIYTVQLLGIMTCIYMCVNDQ